VEEEFGLHIPKIVLKNLIKFVGNKDKDIELEIYENGESFSIKKAWNTTINEEIENRTAYYEECVTRLEEKYKQYLDTMSIENDKTFLDFISDNADDVLDFIKERDCKRIDETYSSVAFFLDFIRENDKELFGVASDMFWGSIISGFLMNYNEISASNNVKKLKSEYFFDTSIVMGLLGLSSASTESYTKDLLFLLKAVNATLRVHPMTIFEVESILSSVESEGARPMTEIYDAMTRYNYKSTDIVNKRVNIKNELNQLGIDVFPIVNSNFVRSQIKEYKNKDIVFELQKERGGRTSFDNFREIHDIFMYDYIRKRSKKSSISDTCTFITPNTDLIRFFKSKNYDERELFVLPNRLIIELWMHGIQNPTIKSSMLTESISRCMYMNKVDIRHKIETLSKYYNENVVDYNKETYDAIMYGLIKRDSKLLSYIDNIDQNENEVQKQLNGMIERGLQIEYNHRKKVEEQIQNNMDERQIHKQKLQELNKRIEDIKIEQSMKEKDYKRQLKLVGEYYNKCIELNGEIEKLEKEREASVSMVKYYMYLFFGFMFIFLFLLIIISFLGVFDLHFSIQWLIGLFFGNLILLFTISNKICTPRILKNEIREEQLNYWDEKHPELKEKQENLCEIEHNIAKIID